LIDRLIDYDDDKSKPLNAFRALQRTRNLRSQAMAEAAVRLNPESLQSMTRTVPLVRPPTLRATTPT